MMSPDTMASTQGDPQESNSMDTSEASIPMDDERPSSAEDALRRKNPFVQSDDDDDDDDEKSTKTEDVTPHLEQNNINYIS